MRCFALLTLILGLVSCNAAVYENRWEPRPGARPAPFSRVLPQCENRAISERNRAESQYIANNQSRVQNLPGANNPLVRTQQGLVNQTIRNNARNAGVRVYNSTLNSCLTSSGYRQVRVCTRNCSN